MYELKRLTHSGIPSALAMGHRYRLLNRPWEAECIYRDILDSESDNQEALIGLVLALTDQFGDFHASSVSEAQGLANRITGEYERSYYTGIIRERRAKAILQQARPGTGSAVYELLHQAMACYEQAEQRRPEGNDEALLRWNACVRLLQRHPRAVAASSERYEPYVD